MVNAHIPSPKSTIGNPDVKVAEAFGDRTENIPDIVVVEGDNYAIRLLQERLQSLVERIDERTSTTHMASASVNVAKLPEGYHFDSKFYGLTCWPLDGEMLNGGFMVLENIVDCNGGMVTLSLPKLAVTQELYDKIQMRHFFHLTILVDPETKEKTYLVDGEPAKSQIVTTTKPFSVIVHRIMLAK